MSGDTQTPAAPSPAARRPIFSITSFAMGVVTLLTLLWPGGKSGSHIIEEALRDFNLALLFLGLLVWGILVLLFHAMSLLLLIPALWRKERPLYWLALAVVLQLIVAFVLWGDVLMPATPPLE